MARVKVLVEGYAKRIEDGWMASSTVTLVQAQGKNIIVDPGCNRQKLLKALAEEGLTIGDIDFVLLTHNHTDHTLLTGIFDKARVLNTEEIFQGDRQLAHQNKIPETGLKLIQTPGHTEEHCSLVVPTDKSIYVIAGDVFWWMEGEEQKLDLNREDPAHPADMRKLVESRKRILEKADYVIPGHGKAFKTPE